MEKQSQNEKSARKTSRENVHAVPFLSMSVCLDVPFGGTFRQNCHRLNSFPFATFEGLTSFLAKYLTLSCKYLWFHRQFKNSWYINIDLWVCGVCACDLNVSLSSIGKKPFDIILLLAFHPIQFYSTVLISPKSSFE